MGMMVAGSAEDSPPHAETAVASATTIEASAPLMSGPPLLPVAPSFPLSRMRARGIGHRPSKQLDVTRSVPDRRRRHRISTHKIFATRVSLAL